ncbi:MAG: cytochrome c family protein [Candidatus Omnitrophota bacterium]|nr:cytochrome c family protein [Candidatus Omnitrophota bacterium]
MRIRSIAAMAVLLLAARSLAAAEGNHKYVGLKKCAICHKSEAKGSQYGQWISTKHATAYERLASPEAKETAKQAGVSGDPQQAPRCLRCHTTAYGVDSSLLGEGFAASDGVQCEACHGAGGDYVGLSVMKDRARSISQGLIIQMKETCLKCHNSESPNYKGFNFEESYKKITHPMPKK